VPPRPFRTTTVADAKAAEAMPDLVKRDFTAAHPGIKFVGDITYVHTWQGFICLATVIDSYSKKVVRWAVEDHMRSELVERALSDAAETTRIESNVIWHSDYAEKNVKPRLGSLRLWFLGCWSVSRLNVSCYFSV
jgi:putative transposase